ncbi:DUF2563 family protein [Nocardia miyunensis]|uniref:DUF2563 family protein n=1 Tax=Nocardia miyunensis TaxID=282684 RepID=UPI000836AF8D|nr:DUF2563 family protein [Nocardia miyunensis]
MYADLDRLTHGKRHTCTAADHVDQARAHLRSAEVNTGMFGSTRAAPNAETVVSRIHARHVRALDDHHGRLTWISEQANDATTSLWEADVAGGAAVRVGDTADRRG